MRAHSLRGRLLGAMLAVFALGLAASLASYRFAFHNIVSDLRARTLQAQARALTAAIRERPDGRLDVRLPADWTAVYADRSRTFTYVIRNASGRPVAWSENLGASPVDLPRAGDAQGEPAAHADSPLDRIALAGAGRDERAVLATRTPGGYIVMVARGDLSRDTLIDSLFEESTEHLAVLVPFAVFALGLIWIVSGWSLRPIARASREAALVRPGRPGAHLSTSGLPREIRPLVDAVNGALDRLTQAYAAERRFTADAAHELRTPLTVLALRLQRARLTGATDWNAIEHELDQMRRLVDQLLDLARKESIAHEPPPAAQSAVNLSRIVREVAASLIPLMETAGRALAVDVPDAAPLHGRAEDLRDMVRNLLENAIRHGRGTVSVRIRASHDPTPSPHTPLPTLLVLEVSDEGPGVPPGDEEIVFDRFRKLDAAAAGSGLGLAIVRQVARSHGGDARFIAGRGCVVITLPAEPAWTPANAAAFAPTRADPAIST